MQGTPRWQSASLFDPTDAGAGGFYSLSESLRQQGVLQPVCMLIWACKKTILRSMKLAHRQQRVSFVPRAPLVPSVACRRCARHFTLHPADVPCLLQCCCCCICNTTDAYNTWTNNAASGGFAGFSFPHAPRPIKEHRLAKKANGFPFDPSQRPFISFKGNTVHSTGYNWEHAGGVSNATKRLIKLDLLIADE